ncbi:hypothetical protein Ccrd_007544, partial [Cynara cardunculus var. scolymus]
MENRSENAKKLGLNKARTNMGELLETCLLEGFQVFFNFGNKGMDLKALTEGMGILCSCCLYEGSKLAVSLEGITILCSRDLVNAMSEAWLPCDCVK